MAAVKAVVFACTFTNALVVISNSEMSMLVVMALRIFPRSMSICFSILAPAGDLMNIETHHILQESMSNISA